MNRKTILRFLLLLPLAAVLAAAVLMGTPQITGEAVQDIVQSNGVGAALVTILAVAAVLGISAYTTIGALPEIEDAICMHSKYWAGYAMQKVEPVQKKKSKPDEKAKPKVVFEDASPTMFEGIAKGIGKTNDTDDTSQDKILKNETKQQKHEKSEDRVAAENNDVPLTAAKDLPRQKMQETVGKADKGTAKAILEETKAVQEAKTTAKTQEECKDMPKPALPKQPSRDKMDERFGTTDPFEIAQKILKRKG